MPYTVEVKRGIGWANDSTWTRKEHAQGRAKALRAKGSTVRIAVHKTPHNPAVGGRVRRTRAR